MESTSYSNNFAINIAIRDPISNRPYRDKIEIVRIVTIDSRIQISLQGILNEVYYMQFLH